MILDPRTSDETSLEAAPIPGSAPAALAKGRARVKFDCLWCHQPSSAPVRTDRAKASLCSDCFGKAPDRRPHQLNDLSGAEWALMSRSVERYPDIRSDKQRDHGACFPQSLAEQQIRMYTKRGQLVLDPFVGVGTTIDAAVALGRRAIGIELNEEFATITRQDLESQRIGRDQALVIRDDARNLLAHVDPASVDFVLTSPPYSNLLKDVGSAFARKWREHSAIDPIRNPSPYSDMKEDLGNMSYADYLDAIQEILTTTRKVLKPKCYAVWIVKDFRRIPSGIPYVNLHGDMIERATRAGFRLWDIRIYDQSTFRPLVCLGYPSRNFYLNIGHSYLVVLRDG